MVSQHGDIVIDFLIVEVAEHPYALALSAVREIHRAVAIVPLPRAPAIIEGVVHVQGEVIAVLDLRARFGLSPRAVEPDDHLVIAFAGARRVAIRVDRAREIVQVRAADIATAPTLSAAAGYVAGAVKLADGIVLIHDLASFLAASEALQLDEARPVGVACAA